MNFKQIQVELLEQNKPFIVLQNVKDTYPNISSQSVILSQIKKMYISDSNHRLPEYKIKITKLICELIVGFGYTFIEKSDFVSFENSTASQFE